jgi:CheY-like chemotaxis protein
LRLAHGISRASRTPSRRDVGLDAVLAALPGPAEVVLLGYPNRDKCLAAGMDEYLSKPIRTQELDAMLEKYAKHRAENAPEAEGILSKK